MGLNKVPALPSIWNVPYRRNPFFTGREDVLKHLHDTLASGKTAALTQPQAISGLGGIGKTQTAVEYAYRYGGEYQAVLWAKADSREALTSDFVSIAGLLDLPQKNEQDQNLVVNAVKHWLQSNNDWLLIFDNVEDWKIVNEYIPSTEKGHILLTTRDSITEPTAQNIEMAKMETVEGTLFLLYRAKTITLDDSLNKADQKDIDIAKKIVQMMDGLPLAIDQAGAYILETKCGLSSYLDRHEKRRAELLNRRGRHFSGHPESVTTTFSLSLEKVQQANPAAAELLWLCAFLHPDDISEEIITEGAPELDPVLHHVADPIKLDEAIGELLKYSLILRDANSKMISIHRLVQAVLKDRMDKDRQQQWAERVVRAIDRVFPDVEFATWHRCQRLVSHALECAILIEQRGMAFPEAAQLLNRAGWYLRERGQYVEAEPLLQQALTIYEQIQGPKHLDAANALSHLAALYHAQGKYTQAEPLFQRALAIHEQALGPENLDLAASLNNLAALYNDWSKHTQAEPLLQRALTIREQILGSEHLSLCYPLNNLGFLYKKQAKYANAEPLYQRTLTIRERALGPEHPDVAASLNNLGVLYRSQGKYTQAEPLLQRALTIREQRLGPEHLYTASSLNNLALLYQVQGKYTLAEPLYQRALVIVEKTFGSVHPYLANSLENYAGLLRKMNREVEAIELEAHAKAIRTQHAQENP
jgi:tetratricopeptide (TPR) repeat protein